MRIIPKSWPADISKWRTKKCESVPDYSRRTYLIRPELRPTERNPTFISAYVYKLFAFIFSFCKYIRLVSSVLFLCTSHVTRKLYCFLIRYDFRRITRINKSMILRKRKIQLFICSYPNGFFFHPIN